jgi:hypothetical protein
VLWLLVTANVVPGSPILVAVMMVALHSSETLVLTKATWHNIPEDGIHHALASLSLRTKINFHIGQLAALLSSCSAALTVPYDGRCILSKHHVSDISTHSGYSLCPFRRAP